MELTTLSFFVKQPFFCLQIRLQLLSPAELTEHVEIKDYLMKTKKCRVHILEAFRYHCLQSQKTDLESPYSFETLEEQHPRKGIEELGSIINFYQSIMK